MANTNPLASKIVQRLIELKESHTLSFASIAAILNEEYPDNNFTKDQIQKIHQKVLPVKARKIVAIGDLHGNPDDALLEMVVTAKPDIVVLGGDIINAEQFNHHLPSHDGLIEALETEQRRCNKKLSALLQSLPDTRLMLMTGNHEDRVRKEILSNVAPSARKHVEIKDPLLEIIADLPRCEIVNTEVKAYYPNKDTVTYGKTRYMLPLGDALISHANYVGVRATDKLAKFAYEWGSYLGWPDFALLIQFHTHRLSMQETAGGHRILVEPGMAGLPKTENYKIGYDAKYVPGVIGGVCFEQEWNHSQWKTRRDSVNFLRPHRF